MTESRRTVFISYCHADSEWVELVLVPKLQQWGLKVLVDTESFLPGAHIVTAIQSAIEESDHVLFVITHAFARSEWTRHELQETIARDPASLRSKAVPLVLDEEAVPDALRRIVWARIGASGAAQEWEKLRIALEPSRESPAMTPDLPGRSSTEDGAWIDVPEGVAVEERRTGRTDDDWEEAKGFDYADRIYLAPETEVGLTSFDLTDDGLADLVRELLEASPELVTNSAAPSTLGSREPKLRRLRLTEAKEIGDASLAWIGRMTSLRELDLSWTGVTGSGIHRLEDIRQLHSLAINGCYRFSTDGFVGIAMLSELRRLEFSMSTYMASVYDARITSDDIAPLVNLAALEHLDLTGSSRLDDRAADTIVELGELRHLDLGGCRLLTDAAVARLCELTELRHLCLRGCDNLGDEGARSIAGTPSVEEVWLNGCSQITEDGVAALLALPDLRVLEVAGCPISDATLEAISQCTKLERLSIASDHITDDGVSLLSRLPKLAWLTIDRSEGLGDGTMDALLTMPSVRTVRLFKNAEYSETKFRQLGESGRILVHWNDHQED